MSTRHGLVALVLFATVASACDAEPAAAPDHSETAERSAATLTTAPASPSPSPSAGHDPAVAMPPGQPEPPEAEPCSRIVRLDWNLDAISPDATVVQVSAYSGG